MTTLDSSRAIAIRLRELATEYLEHEQTVLDFEVSDMLMNIAAQCRFIATLTEQTSGGARDALALLWLAAGRDLLGMFLEQARMDAVHESRASRRVERSGL